MMKYNFEIERDPAEVTMLEAVSLVKEYVEGKISKTEIVKYLQCLKEKYNAANR